MTPKSDKKVLGEKLLEWWRENQRKFPWRATYEAYAILISEVLLHRTKADQVLPVYNRFMKKFPTIESLAKASISDVRKSLHTLGLHWRADSLHRMAKEIVTIHNGKIPSDKNILESLPGIGQYIASAVRCFSLDYPETLLDTNTVRILGRVFGIKISDGSRRSKSFRRLSKSIIVRRKAREFNYAMIDLGALICKSKSVSCHICPLDRFCTYSLRVQSLSCK